MQSVLEYISLAASGLFAGAAVYVSAVEHPARLTLPVREAVAEFRPSYRRGAVMQASHVFIGGMGAIAASLTNGQSQWTIAGALLLTLIPYTLLAILKTNHLLMDTKEPVSDAEAGKLLRRWGRLHAVRTALGLSAFALMLGRIFLT